MCLQLKLLRVAGCGLRGVAGYRLPVIFVAGCKLQVFLSCGLRVAGFQDSRFKIRIQRLKSLIRNDLRESAKSAGNFSAALALERDIKIFSS